jgi:hypothetical protein
MEIKNYHRSIVDLNNPTNNLSNLRKQRVLTLRKFIIDK